MPLTSSRSSPDVTPAKQEQPTARRAAKRVLVALILVLLILPLIVAWQLINTLVNGTDPTVAGRPLSNPHTHLHVVALGGEHGVVYLGTHYGLFTSTDGGQSWPQPRGVLNTMMILALTVSPSNAQDLAIIARPSSGLGNQELYFSTDGGQVWHQSSTPAGLSAMAYLFTIQAGSGSASHFYAFYEYAGWFESQDVGVHWSPITSGVLSTMQIPSLLTDPRDPNHLYLGGDQGLYETRDDGHHWTHLTAVNGSVLNIVASAGSPRLIFCTTDQGLYRWEEEGGLKAPMTHLISLPMSTPPDRLLVDATGRILYALSGHDLWASKDRGSTWQHCFQFDRGDGISFLLDPLNPQHLYAGFFLPAEVRESTDGGQSWHVLTN